MCISVPIHSTPWTSNHEVTFLTRKRSCQQTNSVQSIGGDSFSLISEASSSREKIASTGIMANLETFRQVHRQNGTDFLSYFQQTGQLAIERELALSTLFAYLATRVREARI